MDDNRVDYLATTKTSLSRLSDDFEAELIRFRPDRAHPSRVESILVNVYEQRLPVKQLATIVISDVRTIQIKPFLPDNIKPIVEALHAEAGSDFSPRDDGQTIYLSLPPLTTDYRRQLVKKLQSRREDFLIKLRQIRHGVLKEIRQANLPDSDSRSWLKQLEQLFQTSQNQLKARALTKEQEILNADHH